MVSASHAYGTAQIELEKTLSINATTQTKAQLAVRIARWLSADRASRRLDGAILQVTALTPGMCTLFGVAFAGRKSGLARGRLALGSGLVPLKVFGASQVIACM